MRVVVFWRFWGFWEQWVQALVVLNLDLGRCILDGRGECMEKGINLNVDGGSGIRVAG
jgi:hypothetical protein